MRELWVIEAQVNGEWQPRVAYHKETDAQSVLYEHERLVRYVPESPPLASRSDEGDKQQSGDEE